jgi:hypothetical protein
MVDSSLVARRAKFGLVVVDTTERARERLEIRLGLRVWRKAYGGGAGRRLQEVRTVPCDRSIGVARATLGLSEAVGLPGAATRRARLGLAFAEKEQGLAAGLIARIEDSDAPPDVLDEGVAISRRDLDERAVVIFA